MASPSVSLPNLQNQSARPAARPGERAAPSVIGADLTIVGNLISKGEVQIDGELRGDLNGTHIVVGEQATIAGGILGDEIVVRGRVIGSIRGKKVVLQSSSYVEGDIYHQMLAIELGAFFEGTSRRLEDPTAAIARPEIPVINGVGPLSNE